MLYAFVILVVLHCLIERENQAPRPSVILDDVFNIWSFIAACQLILSFYGLGIFVISFLLREED